MAAALGSSYAAVDIAAFYGAFHSVGLQYGPEFRALRSLWANRDEGVAVGRLRRRCNDAGTKVHPADLDGALQQTGLLAEATSGETRLPFMVGEATLISAKGRMCSIVERQGAYLSRVWLASLCKGKGDSPMVRLDSFESRVLKAMTAPVVATRQQHMYVTQWEAQDAAACDDHAASLALTGSEANLGERSGEHGVADTSHASRSLLFSLPLGSPPGTGVLPALDVAFDIVKQQLSSRPVSAFLLTAGTQYATTTTAARPAHGGLMGLARTVRSEQPSARISSIDVSAASHTSVEEALALGICSTWSGEQLEVEVAVGKRLRRVPRLAEAALSNTGPIRLHFDARGAISNLRIAPQDEMPALEHRQADLSVRAVGLNFRDVLNVLGAYPGDPGPPGSDCAATVAALSGTFAHLQIGDAVLGHAATGSLASVARTDGRLAASIDESLSFEQACTLPTTWCTVHMSLLAARPAAGHSVLLHAGAGGVGLAAGEYSHWLGARVTASVGRPYKHFYLHRMGLAGRTVSSRDGGAFALGASRLLGAARLRFTLNSLSADFIACSFALLGQSGCFGEIGKRAVWSYDQRATATGPCVQYDVVALDSAMAVSPPWMNSVLRLLSARAAAGVLHGLPLQTFDLEKNVLAAFRTLQGGTNTGKVVVRIPKAAPTPPRGAHLLSGGTGGLGLVTGRWLGERGAASVVLAARGGRVAAVEGERLKKLARCDFSVAKCDAAEPADTAQLVGGILGRGTAMAGVWHAAGVLSDGLLRSQTAATVKRVFAPKAFGGVGLHAATLASPLDACVLFSSIAALLGATAQSNYAAANTTLDSLGGARRVRGLIASIGAVGPLGRCGHGGRCVRERAHPGDGHRADWPRRGDAHLPGDAAAASAFHHRAVGGQVVQVPRADERGAGAV